jgi:hypothetical protein
VRDCRVRHALLADEGGERARVDAGERDHTAPLQPLIEVAGGAVVGWIGDVGLEDRADSTGTRGRHEVFDVLVIGADVADMREGEGDDLAGIGGVGQYLLVAGERGVEADLADRAARGAEAAPFDDGPIGQHEQRGRRLVRPGISGHRLAPSHRLFAQPKAWPRGRGARSGSARMSCEASQYGKDGTRSTMRLMCKPN